MKFNKLHGPPFRRPFTTSGVPVRSTGCCMDLHFGDPSQLANRLFTRKEVAWTSISETLHNADRLRSSRRELLRPPFQRPFTTKIIVKDGWKSCMDLHFGDPSQLTPLTSINGRKLHGHPCHSDEGCPMHNRLHLIWRVSSSSLLFNPKALEASQRHQRNITIGIDKAPCPILFLNGMNETVSKRQYGIEFFSSQQDF